VGQPTYAARHADIQNPPANPSTGQRPIEPGSRKESYREHPKEQAVFQVTLRHKSRESAQRCLGAHLPEEEKVGYGAQDESQIGQREINGETPQDLIASRRSEQV